MSLDLELTFPPTYPDVLPEMKFEEVDEDSGELTEEETGTVLDQLRITVSLESSLPSMSHVITKSDCHRSLADIYCRAKNHSGWP